MNPGTDIFEQYLELIASTPEIDDSLINNHIKQLKESEKYLPMGMTFLFITNSSNKKYEYITKNVEYCTHIKRDEIYSGGFDFIFSRIHPHDLDDWHEVTGAIIEEIIKLPLDKKQKCNFQFNYRIKNGYGDYINILEGQIPIAFNKDEIPYLFLSQVTVLGNEIETSPKGVLMLLNNEGEYEKFFEILPNPKAKNNFNLTKRELQILEVINKGLTSREVADNLHISKETVDKHRKNIIKKMGVNNTVAAINLLKNQNPD
ncbi:helix-turn-helix domain-containing protein [Marinigracilibium pacificum]|uniref:HTH luxR-type domain-containing protein n=1 Tax=Marinigracilibium pacificum TaxID=2729599 RepID=A0A848IZ74_9BACT|nr:LuxR family transcriptional regulator [Marinigracilibium pacificum]NMM47299.1 hypothetical protein [Marinigracilibium pacificum]